MVSLEENPSVGPSVETLIEAGAKRTDLIVDGGDWWRLWARERAGVGRGTFVGFFGGGWEGYIRRFLGFGVEVFLVICFRFTVARTRMYNSGVVFGRAT